MAGLVGMHGGLEEMRFWGALMPVVLWVGRVVEEEMRMAVTSWTLGATTTALHMTRLAVKPQHSCLTSLQLE